MSQIFHLEYFWVEVISVLSAFICCSLLGIERSFRQKDAGIKTHVLVGVGACVFTLVSAYGFGPVLSFDVRLDPSRIAAQIVSGIGFLGAGVIFVNNDTVRGITTAATIWLSAAIGVACGAFMIPIALFVLIMHYLLVFVIGPLVNKLIRHEDKDLLVIEYVPGTGTMRKIVLTASGMGFTNVIDSTKRIRTEQGELMQVVMHFFGPGSKSEITHALSAIKGVLSVTKRPNSHLD